MIVIMVTNLLSIVAHDCHYADQLDFNRRRPARKQWTEHFLRPLEHPWSRSAGGNRDRASPESQWSDGAVCVCRGLRAELHYPLRIEEEAHSCERQSGQRKTV